ncbi:hypothetical protein QBC47DRAFT_394529 [Echria macrotheca]|uniref:Uncharacterized protein n=1 Tax=Echria macrotheca TaxID=438768 RepID=A0AAJ0B4I9_9PEZI|nr:hypothetical protein QBC47DRAFT_394529 [Echria macrotheca]
MISSCRSHSFRLLSIHTHLACRRLCTMDISSGNVAFGRTCPGEVMQDFLRDQPENVAKIKKLQTSYSRGEVTYQCPIGCKDPAVLRDFISSIDRLEELSIINYEAEASALWPAIFKHAASLKSLSIHTPPQHHSHLWTPATTAEAVKQLPQLKQLELDVELGEALSWLSSEGVGLEPGRSVVNELSSSKEIESILINVDLEDTASAFAGEQIWDVMGCISFPEPNKEVCKKLASILFEKIRGNPSDGAAVLKHLELRFPRRVWDDRCQFYTVAYSVKIKAGETGDVVVDGEGTWKDYLPDWPEYGGFLWNLAHL